MAERKPVPTLVDIDVKSGRAGLSKGMHPGLLIRSDKYEAVAGRDGRVVGRLYLDEIHVTPDLWVYVGTGHKSMLIEEWHCTPVNAPAAEPR